MVCTKYIYVLLKKRNLCFFICIKLDSLISTSCCSALDHIITYLFKQLTKKKRQSQSNMPESVTQDVTLIQVYQQQPQVFHQMLSNVLNIVIFEDCRNQWSMSRPLLGLILLNEQVIVIFFVDIIFVNCCFFKKKKYFEQWRNNLIASQPTDHQEATSRCITALMNGIEPNLAIKNRDK